MKRDDLKALDLNQEQIDKIMKMNGDDINASKQSLEDAKAAAAVKDSQIKDYEEQISKLKTTAKDTDDAKAQVEQLKNAMKQSQEKAVAELAKAKTDSAVNLALISAGAKDNAVVSPLIDKSIVKLDAKGNVTGLDEQLKEIKKSHDYLFKEATKAKQDAKHAENKEHVFSLFPNGNPAAGSTDKTKAKSLVDIINANMGKKE